MPALGLRLLILGLPILAFQTIAQPAEETLYQSDNLRIYRGTGRHGLPVLVLTNLDAQGNFFPGHRSDAAAVEVRSEPSGSPAPAAGAAPRPAPVAQVQVVVNRGDGAAPTDADDVQVEADGRGGTTVIINIHPPAPPERQTVVVPAGYPVVSYGGLAGPFRYPEHLHFLGYGHDTSAPSYFGGLGLKADNGFGLKTGVACDRGFDCMFGPARDHP